MGASSALHVVFLLCTVYSSTDKSKYLLQSIIPAIRDSFDESRSLQHNYFSILALLCPQSIHCSKTNENATIERGVEGFLNDENMTDDNYEISERIRRARIYLTEVRDQLPGCCKPCSCETYCKERQNCCPEHQVKMANITSTSIKKQECVFADIKTYTNTTYMLSEAFGESYYMVTECFTGNLSESINIKCHSPDKNLMKDILPVYSTSSKRTYRNIYCSECNGDLNVLPWDLEVNINNVFTLTEKTHIPQTPDDLYKMIADKRFSRVVDAFFSPPEEFEIKEHSCYPVSDTLSCTQSDNEEKEYYMDPLMYRLCQFKQSLYHSIQGAFENVFCFICQHGTKEIETKKHSHQCKATRRFIKDSFAAVLVDLPLSNVESLRDTSTQGPCSCDEYLNQKLWECRKLRCRPGTYFVPCKCVEFMKVSSLEINAYLNISPRGHIKELLQPLISTDWLRSLIKSMNIKIKTKWAPNEIWNVAMFRELSKTKKTYARLHTSLLLQFRDEHASVTNIEKLFKDLHKGLWIKVGDNHLMVQLGIIYELEKGNMVPISANNYFNESESMLDNILALSNIVKATILASHIQPLNKLIYCRRVVLRQYEVDLLKNNTKIHQLYPSIDYVFREEDSSLCLEDYIDTFVESCSSSIFHGESISLHLLCKTSLTVVSFLTIKSLTSRTST